jgi:hypothetical protein
LTVSRRDMGVLLWGSGDRRVRAATNDRGRASHARRDSRALRCCAYRLRSSEAGCTYLRVPVGGGVITSRPFGEEGQHGVQKLRGSFDVRHVHRRQLRVPRAGDRRGDLLAVSGRRDGVVRTRDDQSRAADECSGATQIVSRAPRPSFRPRPGVAWRAITANARACAQSEGSIGTAACARSSRFPRRHRVRRSRKSRRDHRPSLGSSERNQVSTSRSAAAFGLLSSDRHW